MGTRSIFERIAASLIAPAVRAAGLEADITVETVESGDIRLDMFGRIQEADIVICDVTFRNANVLYELGVFIPFDWPADRGLTCRRDNLRSRYRG